MQKRKNYSIMWYTEKITITLPKENKMGLTRPKLQQMEKKPKLKDNDFILGMVKNIIRIGACYMLYTGNIEMAAVTLVIAEFTGIGNRLI